MSTKAPATPVIVTDNGTHYLGYLKNNTLSEGMEITLPLSDNAIKDYIKDKELGELATIELGAANTHNVKQLKEEEKLRIGHFLGMYEIARKKAMPTVVNQAFDALVGK